MNKSGIHMRRRLLTVALSAAILAGLGACAQESPPAALSGKSGGSTEQSGNAEATPVSNPGYAPGSVFADAAAGDAALVAQVKSALGEDPVLKMFALDVSTAQGVVWLYGVVDTMGNRGRAGDLALNVPGVLSVRNNIHLAHGTMMVAGPRPAALASNK